MTKLIFITHPAVIINQNIPIDQWPLSQAGLEDLSRLLQRDFWGSVDKIYSSAEQKASTVAETVSREKDITLTTDYKRDCLGEIRNRTFIEPSIFGDAVTAWYKSPNDNPNGWESVTDAQKRIVDCVTTLMAKNKGKTVVIVGHGGTGTLLMCHIKNVKPSFKDDPLTTGCIAMYDWDRQKIISPWQKF